MKDNLNRSVFAFRPVLPVFRVLIILGTLAAWALIPPPAHAEADVGDVTGEITAGAVAGAAGNGLKTAVVGLTAAQITGRGEIVAYHLNPRVTVEPPPGCVCIYQDHADQTQTFKDTCTQVDQLGYSHSARQFLENKGCKQMMLVPLSRISEIAKTQGSSFVVAYVGNAYAMRFPELARECVKLAPPGCKGPACIRSFGCGDRADHNAFKQDQKLLDSLAKTYGVITVSGNETQARPEECRQTQVAYKVFIPHGAKHAIAEANLSGCKLVGTSDTDPNGFCSAPIDNYHGHKYVNWWDCNDTDGMPVIQYCCGAYYYDDNTKLHYGQWNPPGIPCETQKNQR